MEKLDIIFSQYIRLRDTDENGYGKCITCQKTFHYKDLECGHFRHRRHMCTRWHSRNAHAQCVECNRGDSMVSYIVAMMNMYSDNTVSEILWLSNQGCKFTKQELKDKYNYYSELVKSMKAEKMFKI